VAEGIIKKHEVGVLDSTAHMLKFLSFQEMYFNDTFDPVFNVTPKQELRNSPILIKSERLKKYPEPGKPLEGEDMSNYIREMSSEIAEILELEKR
jgi:threonine synthase